MNKIFCVGDIHGCLNELKILMDKIKFTPEDMLIFIGDYIDRGPDSRGVLDLLMKLKKEYKNVFFLRGNHEQMFLDFLENPNQDHIYLHNGGWKTLDCFRNPGGGSAGWDIPEEYLEFIESTIPCYAMKEYFFVHAGVPDKDLADINETDFKNMLWLRDSFLKSEYSWEATIIHGHTPHNDGIVEFKDNRINIDTGCVYGGKLTCLELPSEKVYQVDKKC